MIPQYMNTHKKLHVTVSVHVGWLFNRTVYRKLVDP